MSFVPWPEARSGNQAFTNAAVVVIGAGLSGMCVGIDLLKRGIKNFVILEKSAGVGGTWRDNKYPGCACDIWSLLYSYSFEQKSDWTRLYPGQEEILEYLTTVAEKYRLHSYVRFNTSVETAVWDDDAAKWHTSVRVSGEKDSQFQNEYTVTSDFLVSAVGQLNEPAWPSIDGLGDFAGKVMHSARWDWSYDLTGKKVAIIGNGATAVQIVPEVAKVAAKLTVFQRTPNWIVNRKDQPVSSLQQALFKWVPPLRWMARSYMMDVRESIYDAVTNTEGYYSQLFRSQCIEGIEKHIKDKKLQKALVPEYSPLCKRVIISDDFYATLARPNVRLETRPIAEVTSTGIKIMDDSETLTDEDFDLIVCATGFKTRQFLHPVKITGKNGVSLQDVWAGGAKALYGIAVESMPNFAMLYGPNTNLGHNSIILMVEAQTRWLNTLVETVLRSRTSNPATSLSRPLSLSPKPSRIEEYNKKLQQHLEQSTFADPRCNSWYKDPNTGLITNNWPDTVVAYQKTLSKIDWSDFEGGEEVTVTGVDEKYIGRVREESLIAPGNLAMMSMAGFAIAAAALAARRLPGIVRF